MDGYNFQWKYTIGIECEKFSPRIFKEVDGKLIECVKIKNKKRKKESNDRK